MAGRARTAAASAPGAPGTAVAPAASATAPGRVLAVQFLHEQTPGSGEDAEPLLTTLGTDAALLAVFDGLGGAGSETVGTAGGPRSGAYLASRLAGEVVERCSYVLRATAATGELPGKPAQRALGADFARRLETDLHLEFSRAAQQLGSPRTRLRSTLFKTLPTTLVAAHCLYDAAAGAGQVEVYWA
ncbi:MAG: hypothetical protein ACRD0F_01540, partial [Acidimicrobiales bacterium]